MKQKIILLVLGVGIGVIAGGTSGYIIGHSANKTPASAPQQNNEVTLEGKVICLTHKGDGPHTLECAVGFKTNDSKTYGIEANLDNTPLPDATGSNKTVRITGVIKSAADDTYETSGTLVVTRFAFI